MRKQLLLFGLIFLSLFGFAQSSGSLSGTVSNSGTTNVYYITSAGSGYYSFTGSFSRIATTGYNWTGISSHFPSFTTGYYYGGDDNTSNSNINFSTDCVDLNQQFEVRISTPDNGGNTPTSYTVNYTFVPAMYSSDTEPNNTYSQGISTNESALYEGYLNSSLSEYNTPADDDNEDWYTFTSPSNGNLIISLTEDAIGVYTAPGANANLYDDLQNVITPTTTSTNGNIKTYTYENFNFSGNNFGIQIMGSCTSYQLSWEIQSTLGTESYELKNSIELYPNPVSNILNIKNKNNLNIEKIEFIEITGKLIFKGAVANNSISIENLDNGIYFAKIYTDKGIITKKIIKLQ